VLEWQYIHFHIVMTLTYLLKKLTADTKFERTRRGTPLRLTNIDKPYVTASCLIDSYNQLLYYDNKLGYFILPKVEAWLKEHTQGKYRIDNHNDTIVVHFSRESDAVMYKLSGPYV
jgi:hypothetical protein